MKYLIFIIAIFNLKTGYSASLDSIYTKAKIESWETYLPGEQIVRIGKEFMGLPYVGGTLDRDSVEKCSFNLNELDCVTFFEQALAIQNLINREIKSEDLEEELISEITKTRYRNDKVEGYLSRLHYTSEWILENVKSGRVRDITQEIGGEVYPNQLDFMSNNPQWYDGLWMNDPAIKEMQRIENSISANTFYYIPKKKLNDSHLKQLQTGDIVLITTDRPGLDYSHTGLVLVDEEGVKLFHASSKKKKVLIDTYLKKYLMSVNVHTGITILRVN